MMAKGGHQLFKLRPVGGTAFWKIGAPTYPFGFRSSRRST